jgi:hypothetical protein
VSVVFFPGCPNWQPAGARVRAALQDVGLAMVDVEFVAADSDDAADLFGGPAGAAGLSCRVHRTGSGGPAGVPEADLAAALRKRRVV